MKVSELRDHGITDALVDRILFEGIAADDSAFLDAAIILGSSKAPLYRLPPVVEAYKQGRVRLLVPSGHTRSVNEQLINEGEVLRDRALELGVRPEDLLVENRAGNTWENLSFSRALLERKGLLSRGMTVAVATSSYHMRRSLLIAERVFENDGLRIAALPGEDSSTTRESWFTNEKGRKRCYGEVSKILWSIAQGRIRDWDLE